MASDLTGLLLAGVYGNSKRPRLGAGKVDILFATFVCRARRSRSDGFVGSFLSINVTTSISSSIAIQKKAEVVKRRMKLVKFDDE